MGAAAERLARPRATPQAAAVALGSLGLLLLLVSPPKTLTGWRAPPAAGGGEMARLRELYLTSVRDSILGIHLATPSVVPAKHHSTKELQTTPYNAAKRERGNDWPAHGLSMSGRLRLDSLRQLVEDVLRRGMPGSIAECGVWRGGASLFAKAVLAAHGAQREVHLVDSFQGLPPNTTAQDQQWWSDMDYLRVSQEEVRAGFQRFGLLDGSVHFHKGYFRYSLPAWRARDSGPIAVLRMDGDMFESTMDQLYNLWEAVSPGGYVIIDDWTIPECQRAVREFFSRHGLDLQMTPIDDYAAWLQKKDGGPIDHSWYRRFNASRSTADAKGAAE